MREHANRIASLAYRYFGKEAPEGVSDGYYAALRGQGYKAAVRALDRCMKHAGRVFPPTGPEILQEIQNEARERRMNADPKSIWRPKNPELVWGKYRDGAPLKPDVFHRQVVEAKQKYPHLFSSRSGFDMGGLINAIDRRLAFDAQRFAVPEHDSDPWEKMIAATEHETDGVPF